MYRLISAAVLSAALAFGMSAPVSAQSARHVHQSGNTFHVEACAGPSAPGTARCHARIVSDSAGNVLADRGRNGVHMAAGVTRNATPAGFGPSDLRSAYGISGNGSAATTIAIVDAYGYTNAEADLGVYRAQYGLPACTTANGCFKKVNQNGVQGSYPAQNTGWAQETALDLDMASAMCPGCKILLVEANSTSYADLAAAENRAAALGAHVISNSYGGGESGTTSYESAYNHAGVAITVSSGDSGYGVQFPASSPHVTAVGGTNLARASNARGWSETAWVDAGSGCSTVYAKPTWQHDSLCTKRMEADVSAVADPNTGVAVYGPVTSRTSGWQVYGGTSVAAPLIGGIYGVNAGTVSYGSNPYGSTTNLNDVTSGSNGSCGGTYFCTAGAAYDGPTGLGTPKNATPF
ncbi:MAG: S53 family peptidase [Proteobacteria bacterium]|nr:S53 family peptidase [Pseudomonadota bacterium]